MITNADLPRELNLASWFVDRNVEEGRGDRTALISAAGPTTYAELGAAREPVRKPAPRARRAGPGSSPARPRRLGGLRRALVRRAEDRRSHDRGVHVPPAEGLRVLPRVHRRSRRGRGRDDAGRDPPGRRRAGESSSSTISSGRGSMQLSDELEPAPTTKDDVCALEVHDRKHRPAEGRRPSRAQPGPQPRVVRARRARDPRGRRRAPGAEALLRVRPRPDRALSVRRRRRRDRLPRAHDAGADLRADRRAPADDPRQRSDDDGADDRLDRTWRCQAPDMSCLRVCTSAGEALPRELHDRWLDTFGVEVLDGIGSCELYHIYISNRPGRARRRLDGRARPGLRGRARRERRAARHGRHGRARVLGRRREDEGDTSRATPSTRATCSSATTTGSSGTEAASTT